MLSILLTLSNHVVAAPHDAVGSAKSPTTEHFEIGLNSDRVNPLVQVDVSTVQFDESEDSNKKMADVISKKSNSPNATVLLSTDSASLLTELSKNPTFVKENVTAIPIETEALPAPKSNFRQLAKNFVSSRIDSALNDKIGFMVVTYTTAHETLIWIHSTQLGRFESTSNAIYTVVLAVIFGLNKDMWAQTARPIQKFFRKLIKPADLSPTNGKELAVRFLGNLTLTMMVSGLRIPMISMDQMIEKGLQLHFFTMPLLMATVSTAAIFTWSENIAMIDKNKNPIAKFIFRRTSEIRSIIVGTFATTAALLNPGEYGATPWLTMAGVGVTGALVYFNSETITQWLESRKALQSVKAIFSKDDLKKEKAPAMMALQCHSLFVN
ncbi:MAG: hypothetical protein H7256_03715 [Bdellovibrio sp.]|nr:hypothetical protein [Bdellovibrio sp.]